MFKEFFNERSNINTHTEQIGNGVYKIFLKINDDVIGYVTLSTKFDDKHLWIQSIYIIPEYRGKGLFKLLINKVDDFRKKYYNKPILIKVYPFKDELLLI